MNEKWSKTLIRFIKPCKGKLILSIISALISVAGGLIPYIGVYKIIIMFVNKQATFEKALFWGIICVLGHVIKLSFYALSTTLSHISAYTILEQIRLKISQKLMTAPLGNVMDEPIGKIKNIIVDRVETIEVPLAHVIPEGISNFCLSIAIFVYVMSIDWRMGLAGIITIPLAGIAYGGALKSYNKLYKNYMESSNYVNGVIVEYIEGIEVIKAFNQSSSSYKKYSDAVKMFLDYTLQWFRSTWKSMNLGAAILPSTLLGTMPIGMILYLKGSLSPSNMVMCMLLSMGLVNPLMTFTTFLNDVKSIEYAIRDANVYLNLPELEQSEEKVSLKGFNVELQDVSFSYFNKSSNYALKNFNLYIPEGKFYALVGPSGSGKSTVGRLINRFWDVTGGKIKIGDVNIRDIPLCQLASKISYVTQDNFLFNCSIKENIKLGNPNATDKEVYKAAKLAMCDEFIKKLDKGYDTEAGDAGRGLSGGEKQRIAIARAILKDAPIVILDEATAFTDPENEEEIQKSIAYLTKGKTLIVIAHRLSTVKDADKIIVLKEGKIESSGTHESLLQSSNLYKEMWLAHIGAKNWSVNEGRKGGEYCV